MRLGFGLAILGACSFNGPPGGVLDAPDGAVAACSRPTGPVLRLRAEADNAPTGFNGTLGGPWGSKTINQIDIDQARWIEAVDGYDSSMAIGVRLINDTDMLAFGIEVTDENIVAPEDGADPTDGDAVVLFIDAANDRGGEYGADDHIVVIDASGDIADLGQAPITSFQIGVTSTARGWNAEVGFDKSDLTGAVLPAVLGFNIALVDDDDAATAGRDAIGSWEAPDGAGCPDACAGDSSPLCDTTLFGELELL